MTQVTIDLTVEPDYIQISCVKEICEVWLQLWGGDEWGESMQSLAGACHTSYGFSDEDCALFATKLLENLDYQYTHWIVPEGWSYGYLEKDDMARLREECLEIALDWMRGGNLGNWADSPRKGQEMVRSLPDWIFKPSAGELEVYAAREQWERARQDDEREM